MAYQQFLQAAAGFGLGVLLAVSYDIYRLIFRGKKASSAPTFAGDFLWWCFAFLGTFVLLVFLTWGQVRFFFLLFMAAGFLLWRSFCSHGFRRILALIGHGLFYVISRFLNVVERLLTVFLWPLFALFRLVYGLLYLLWRLARKGLRIIKALLRLFCKLLLKIWRNFLPPKPPEEN